MTPPAIVIVVLSGFTAPMAELVAAAIPAATMARGAAAPELPLGVATIRLAAPVGGMALIAPLPEMEVVAPSDFTAPTWDPVPNGSNDGESRVDGVAFSPATICGEVAVAPVLVLFAKTMPVLGKVAPPALAIAA